MGPNSEMAIDEYNFVPIEGRLSFVVKFIHGTITYLSGQISKLSPQSVRLETPWRPSVCGEHRFSSSWEDELPYTLEAAVDQKAAVGEYDLEWG